jgi:SET domain-containing protein 6
MMCESLRDISIWLDYLAVLPEKLDCLVFWSPEELEELQASAVVHKVWKASAEKIFGEKVLALGIRGESIEKLHQMASIIMAYAFDLPEDDLEELCEDDHAEELIPDYDNDRKMVLSMVPLADMLNADADLNNARLCCDKGYLEMRTIKPIMKGD